jgi:hypothetical protein
MWPGCKRGKERVITSIASREDGEVMKRQAETKELATEQRQGTVTILRK